MKSKAQCVFEEFSKYLLDNGIVTQQEVSTIARKGTRKEKLWKRHIIDLANYVIDTEKGMEELCIKMKEWCKQKP